MTMKNGVEGADGAGGDAQPRTVVVKTAETVTDIKLIDLAYLPYDQLERVKVRVYILHELLVRVTSGALQYYCWTHSD